MPAGSDNYEYTRIRQSAKTIEMQNQKMLIRSGPSQKAGSDTLPENIGPGKNVPPKAGADAVPPTGLRLHLLAKELRTIRLFETMVITGKENDKDIFNIVDTEAKQLQAIEDLYKIVKAQPKYKNLKEPSWRVEDDPIQVLTWLLKKLGPLAKGDHWTTDIYQQGDTTRYRFVVYKFYHRQKVDADDQFIPFDFLPVLSKRDLPLHNIIIDLVAFVSQVNKIPFWDEDGDFSEPLKNLVAGPISGNDTLDKQLLSYRKGVAATYLKLFKQRRKHVTRESLSDLLWNYEFKSQRKQDIRNWITLGFHLVNHKGNIKQNTFVPNFNTGTPTTPFRQFKFVWSLHSHDYLKVKAFDKLRKDDSAFGSYMPIMFSVTKPGQKVTLPGYEWFPEGLYEFMKYGYGLFTGRYRQYFYKNQFNETKTPAESLMQQIEISEIQAGFIQSQTQIRLTV